MVTDVASCQWLSSTNKKESNRRKQGWEKVESDSCLYISSAASKQVTALYHVSRQPLKGGKLRFEMKTCQRQVQKTMTTARPLGRRRFIPHSQSMSLCFIMVTQITIIKSITLVSSFIHHMKKDDGLCIE